MRDDSVTLTLTPDWQANESGDNLVLFIQATTSSLRLQRVGVTGVGLHDDTVVALSTPEMAYGKQYLNYQFVLPQSALLEPGWTWTVAISSSNDDGLTWTPSEVRVSDNVSMCEGLVYSVFAFANDDGDTDRDFNDTVVQVSAFNNSED
ncbi:MAG: hypothetical protein QOC81_4687 [Thermoanaerobaculia bacterium]|jgi:hypothetical protein|nr:hypothetical protein [Thermoanaerobaculia bacterium]